MKKKLTFLCISLSAMLILDTLNAGHALVMLLLAGVVPGTSIVIDASLMFEYILLLTGFTLSRITLGLARSYAARGGLIAQPSNGTILSAQS